MMLAALYLPSDLMLFQQELGQWAHTETQKGPSEHQETLFFL